MIPISVESSCFHTSQTPYLCGRGLLTYLQNCILIIKMHEIWLVDSQKIIKILATTCPILKLNARNSISDGALPQTPLGELTALPQTA